MKMESMENVLEKIERKIISSGNVYGAMNYTVWTIILAAYLIVNTALYIYAENSVGGWIYGVFWSVALAIVIYINAIVWKKAEHLRMSGKGGKYRHIVMSAGWIIGGLLWFTLPLILSDPWIYVVGFLIFIICGNAGIALGVRDYRASMPIVTSLISIPLLPRNAGYFAWSMAVEFVLIGYVISALLYMWGAFTLIGEE